MKKLLKKTILAALAIMLFSPVNADQKENNKKDENILKSKNSKIMSKFIFPELPYSYDALEPFIDKMTMEIHYSKHHKAYYDNFINSIAGTDLESKSIEEIFENISKFSPAVRNNGGGYYNHVIYWENMKKEATQPSQKLLKAINETFGSMDELKRLFGDAGKTRFGSGWAWLSVDKNGKLFVSSTANQDNPLMDVADKKGAPILGMDVWEHAYYLKYQNKRPDYIEAFWNVINWDVVSKRYEDLVK